MIARESFEKGLPRFASAAPFLCLIDDHCYGGHRLVLGVVGVPPSRTGRGACVHAQVVGELRMERREQEPAVADKDRLLAERADHLDARPEGADARAR